MEIELNYITKRISEVNNDIHNLENEIITLKAIHKKLDNEKA